jgi:hypothetical protein
MTPEQLAELFHTTYERLAPSFGYETRPGTAKPWSEIPEDNKNKRLMIAVAGEVLRQLHEDNRTASSRATRGMDRLEELVGLSIGRISMCWSETPKGVFNDTYARQIAQDLLLAIAQHEQEVVERERMRPGPEANAEIAHMKGLL